MTESIKQEIGALALDLKRVAIGYQNNSPEMSATFLTAVEKQLDKLKQYRFGPEIKGYLSKVRRLVSKKYSYNQADDALTYSTLLLASSGLYR